MHPPPYDALSCAPCRYNLIYLTWGLTILAMFLVVENLNRTTSPRKCGHFPTVKRSSNLPSIARAKKISGFLRMLGRLTRRHELLRTPNLARVQTLFPNLARVQTLFSNDYNACLQWVKATTVFENQFVSVRLFVVPPYQTIPLHDHPGMIVYSRLYRGDVHAFSMSWCCEDGSSKQVAQGIWPPADLSSGTGLMHCTLQKAVVAHV